MSADSHPFEQRYAAVWQQTLEKGELVAEDVAKSQFYFDFDDPARPNPKLFNTFGAVALMPMPLEAELALSEAWEHVTSLAQHPLAYGVEPENRHVELILFSRPEEEFSQPTIDASVEASFRRLRTIPPRTFTAEFRYPFMTPDGTIVVPGYPSPATAIDDFRGAVRAAVGEDNIPKRQSQWFHISLGRILEPMAQERLRLLLSDMEEHWNEPIAQLTISKVLWTHEKQWYMLQKNILHVLELDSELVPQQVA